MEKLKIYHVGKTRAKGVHYRKDQLRLLLEKDPRFCYTLLLEGLTEDHARLQKNDVLLVSNPLLLRNEQDILQEVLERGVHLIYDCSDNWTTAKSLIKIGPIENILITKADWIGTSARYLKDNILSKVENASVKFYPNGVNMMAPELSTDVEKLENTYIYPGQAKKIDWDFITKFLIYNNSYLHIFNVWGTEDFRLPSSYTKRVTVYQCKDYEDYMKILPRYQGVLLPFMANDEFCNHGMLPLKVFDAVHARIPVYYTNCTELDHPSFKDVAFNIEKGPFEKREVSEEAFAEVEQKYNMEKSLQAFIDDFYDAVIKKING